MYALDPVRHTAWQTRSLTCARISLIGALIATMLSTALVNLLILSALLAWAVSGFRCPGYHPTLWRNPAWLTSLGLIALMLLSWLWHDARPGSLETLMKYRKLLLLPLCLVLFHEQVWRTRALRSYLSVASVLLCMSALLAVAHLAGFSVPDYSSITPLEPLTGQSYLILAATALPASFAGFVLITGHRELGWRLTGGLILLLGLAYVVWLQSGRTTYLVALALMMLAMLQMLRDRGISLHRGLLGLSLLAITLALVWWLSPQLQDRVIQAYSELQAFSLAQSPDTSIGYRVDFWLASISIIQQVPMMGLGPGEWPQAYESWQASVRPASEVIASGNPHNEYLLLGSELGLLGPILLLLLLLASAWQGWKGRLGSPPENQAVLVVSVTFLAGCMFNSWLFDQNPGHFMALSLGILMASLNTRETHR